jgi:hypothetical protein
MSCLYHKNHGKEERETGSQFFYIQIEKLKKIKLSVTRKTKLYNDYDNNYNDYENLKEILNYQLQRKTINYNDYDKSCCLVTLW